MSRDSSTAGGTFDTRLIPDELKKEEYQCKYGKLICQMNFSSTLSELQKEALLLRRPVGEELQIDARASGDDRPRGWSVKNVAEGITDLILLQDKLVKLTALVLLHLRVKMGSQDQLQSSVQMSLHRKRQTRVRRRGHLSWRGSLNSQCC